MRKTARALPGPCPSPSLASPPKTCPSPAHRAYVGYSYLIRFPLARRVSDPMQPSGGGSHRRLPALEAHTITSKFFFLLEPRLQSAARPMADNSAAVTLWRTAAFTLQRILHVPIRKSL